LLQPKNLKSEVFLEQLKSFKADIQVVIAFRMLPEAVWNMPPMGTVNIHASLLPQYRGAAPINWAIINGETQTGVTSFKLKHEIDTGDILLQKSCAISNDDTAGSLHDKLMVLGAKTIIETLERIIDNSIQEQAQIEFNTEDLKSAPKLYSSTCLIDWNKKGVDIINFIRGLCPYPVAHTTLNNKRLKVYKAVFESQSHDLVAGEFVFELKDQIKVSCKDGFIQLLDVQLEGKRRMKIEEFLRGYKT
jgi:methionyl-tRNA formyltransferase